MSTNGPASQGGVDSRSSFDSDRSNASSSPVITNGVLNGRNHAAEDDSDPISQLQHQLERTMEEKETLAAQYRNLLAKLTTMKTSLGNKLKQDAEELDRREQLLQQLTAQNEDLSSTVETLRQELIASHEDAERTSNELAVVRTRAVQETAQENLLRERELREAQSELERSRLERAEWERMAMQERVIADEAKSAAEAFKRDVELEREARACEAAELELEREKSHNLQSVLEDFQAAKDHELRQAVKDYESRLTTVTQSLAEYKHRALTAELKLEESHVDTSRTQELEKETKEKNLIIGKLRHEVVIINEHLMEALRRLRRNSSDTNVDRRLVTNVLLSFLTTPREDAKRFEMLGLLATILSWTDPERERAGLQRAQAPPPRSSSSFWGRSPSVASPSKTNTELEKTDETESFSRLWVEFLLTEAAAGSGSPPPPRTHGSAPGSPLSITHSQSFSALSAASAPGSDGPSKKEPRRLSTAATTSSPNLMLGSPPPRKGKEKETDS